MIKKIIKFSLFLVIIAITLIVYLSFFGVSTKRLNNQIKSEVLNINKSVNLELKSVKLLLNPLNLTINVKTFEPKILINNNKLELEYIKTNISLKSLINKKFLIDDLQISTKAIKVNDLILLVRSFKNSVELFVLGNIIKDGFLVSDINLNFDNNGKIKNDYEINGFIKKGKLDFLRKYSIDDLNLVFNIKDKKYYLEDIRGNFNQIRLSSQSIQIKEKDNYFLINGKFKNDKKDIDTKILNNLLENRFKDSTIKKISFSSENDFSFALNKKFKISDFNLESIIDLNNFVYKNNSLDIQRYLPNFKDTIKLEDHKISINYKKDKLEIKGKGSISIDNKIDHLGYELNKKNNNYNFNTTINLEKNSLLLDVLSYKKDKDLQAIVNVSGSYKKNKEIKFNSISLSDNDANIFAIKGLNLNNEFKINNINSLDFNYINKNKNKNQISLRKNNNKYEIYGKSFDATKLIDKLLNGDNDEESPSIFNNLNSKINIKINKTYLDKVTFMNGLTGNINFKNNKINQLNLKSFFPNKKKLILTISTNKNNEKITTLFSDYPKPLIKQYKFLKGFDEGVLDFYSVKKNGVSNSVLTIDNFKLQEIPVLAKLLTLASLQGITDLLTGEGIRFTDFEMKFSNNKGLMTIDEMYSIGPAISILMDGYIEDNKLISLRGTLVPATTINRTIASIPLIGNILIGKKTGEGVFGVSFKIKGQSNNLKTSVNPIKTLTPRFITRTLEKIKKN